MVSDRYSKQTHFQELGEAGQSKLLDAKVVIIGVGATGSFLASLLARAGVGKLKVIDRDSVELSNLQRQILYDEDDLGTPKAVAAQRKLKKINSEIDVEALVADVTSRNIEEIISGCDLVLDGSDNFIIRYVINDACRKNAKPWVYTGVIGGHGVSMVIQNGGPCFRCYLPEVPAAGQLETCDTSGVLGATVGVLASYSTVTAIKLLTRIPLDHEVLIAHVWDPSVHLMPLKRNSNCICCVQNSYDFLTGKYDPEAVSLCGRNAVHIQSVNSEVFKLSTLSERISGVLSGASFNEHTLKFTVDGYEFVIFKDGRAIIKGTQDLNVAKSLYSKYVGI